MRFFLLILKNLQRNRLRSLLTALAVVALVFVFSMINTFMRVFTGALAEKSKDVNVMLSGRYRMMAAFDRSYMDRMVTSGTSLNRQLTQIPGFHADKYNIWHFAAFSIDPEMKNQNLVFFVLACLPEKIATMTEGLEDDFDPRLVELMRKPPRSGLDNAGIVMGATQLTKLHKRVGDVFKAKSLMHREGTELRQPIEMEFEIVGVIPEGNRWSHRAFMDYAYLDRVLKAKKNELDGKVFFGLLQVDDTTSATAVGGCIENDIRDLRVETMSTAMGRFLAPLKDILWGVQYILVPAILVVMTVILANTFSLTVRERQREMAVLKVLGFRARQILVLVLGESALVGLLAGLLGAALTYGYINGVRGGIHLEMFPVLKVPLAIFWWGPTMGIATALLGAVLPAWNASCVKVSEAFAGTA
jgi:ABC-type lipoprotein release transport system permease subunit